jgi:1-acyl-sn-glycerol-3-phosphate acyltransferase
LLYWLMKYVLVGPWLRLLFRPWVQGLENIPEDGPAILASNHLSFSDSVFLPLMVDRHITFLAKSDYFTGRGLKGRLTAWFLGAVGQVPVDRTGGRASEAAIATGLRVLGEGKLYRGKTGVARMALETQVPVIPVAMINTREVQPPGKIVPRLGRVGIRIGTPLDFSRYEGMEDDRFVLRSVTDELMYELMELAGQEYVDVYASRAKAGPSATSGVDVDESRPTVTAA